MDGKLWKQVYLKVHQVCKQQIRASGPGRPLNHPLEAVLAVWLLAALMNWPVSVTHRRLTRGVTGWWLRRHFRWRWAIPSLATLSRRARQPVFRQILHEILASLRLPSAATVTLAFLDATVLPTGFFSHDRQSTWTCHGGKWLRGYALHVLVDAARGLRAWALHPANVQEMKVAHVLIPQAGMIPGLQVLVGDSSYDGEILHQEVQAHLHAPRLAPLNRRGSETPVSQPGRQAADQRLQTPEGQALWNQRSEIERWIGRFKSFGQLFVLPPYIRHLDRVTIWVMLKLVLFLQQERLGEQNQKVA